MDGKHDTELKLLYLQYLDTDKVIPKTIKEKFYKAGILERPNQPAKTTLTPKDNTTIESKKTAKEYYNNKQTYYERKVKPITPQNNTANYVNSPNGHYNDVVNNLEPDFNNIDIENFTPRANEIKALEALKAPPQGIPQGIPMYNPLTGRTTGQDNKGQSPHCNSVANPDPILDETRPLQDFKEFTPENPTRDNPIRIKADKLIGDKINTQTALEAVFYNNSLNKIGHVNYNKYGTKGHELKTISNVFVDNFLLYSIVRAKNTKGRQCSETGALNAQLVSTLKSYGLNKSRVKAIQIGDYTPTFGEILSYKHANPTQQDIKADEKWKKQTFKIATADEEEEDIRKFLTKDMLNLLKRGNFYLADIDYTQDLSGSFNKKEIIKHLQDEYGFKLQGEGGNLDNGDKIVVDNNNVVGNNCLTFLKKIDGKQTRWKIYNKFTQSVESASVRSRTGDHIADWINNPEERLRETIDKAIDEGLTRLEITYYNFIPESKQVKDDIEILKKYIPYDKAYRTPIKEQWKSLTEALKHTLIIYDEEGGNVLFGTMYNELTQKITGCFLNNCCKKKLKWLITACSLDKSLLIDVIYVKLITGFKTLKTGLRAKNESITHLELYSKTYRKEGYNKTHIIKGCYIFYSRTDGKTPQEAGLIDTPTIKPYIHTKRVNKNSRTPAEYSEVKTPFKINFYSDKHLTKIKIQEGLRIAKERDDKQRAEQRKKEVEVLERQERIRFIRQQHYEIYRTTLKNKATKLLELKDDTILYIEACKKRETRYGQTYIVLARGDTDDELKAFWSDKGTTRFLNNILTEELRGKSHHYEGGIYYKQSGLLGIKKVATRYYKGNAYAEIEQILNVKEMEGKKEERELKQLRQHLKIIQLDDKSIDNKRLKKLDDVLTEGQTIKITHIARQIFRKAERFIIKMEGDSNLYINNHWLRVIIQQKLKLKPIDNDINNMDILYLIVDVKRTTPQKKKRYKFKKV